MKNKQLKKMVTGFNDLLPVAIPYDLLWTMIHSYQVDE